MENPQEQPRNDELAERLRQLEEEAARLREALTAPEAKAEPEPEPEPEPAAEVEEEARPSPEDEEKAIQALGRYRLEKNRGNTDFARRHLDEARGLAPKNSHVLEADADELVAQRKYKEAAAIYKESMEADPKNKSAEKKHADLVFRTQAQAAALEVNFGGTDTVASSKTASVLTAFFPGLGQVVLGEWVKGGIFILLWIGAILWIVFTPGIPELVRGRLDFGALLPLGGAFLVWFAAMIDASASSKVAEKRRVLQTKEPVRPPVDLPYE